MEFVNAFPFYMSLLGGSVGPGPLKNRGNDAGHKVDFEIIAIFRSILITFSKMFFSQLRNMTRTTMASWISGNFERCYEHRG